MGEVLGQTRVGGRKLLLYLRGNLGYGQKVDGKNRGHTWIKKSWTTNLRPDRKATLQTAPPVVSPGRAAVKDRSLLPGNGEWVY